MDRRSFLKGAAVAIAAAPAVAEAAAVRKPTGIRISRNPGDPGYRAYCIARGDQCRIEVLLNGKKAKFVQTADETTGMIIKGVETPNGNIAHDGDEFLEEVVYGDVTILIEDVKVRRV